MGRNLVDVAAELPSTPFDGEAYRHLAPKYWPLSAEGARRRGGRWNPANSFPALYLGLTKEVAGAELRAAAAKQGLDLADVLPRVCYRYEIHVEKVLDLTDDGHLRALELRAAEVRADDWRPCQEAGLTVHLAGFEGLLAESATGSGVALVLFLDRLTSACDVSTTNCEQWFRLDDVP